MKTEKRVMQANGLSVRYTMHIKKVKNISLRISEDGEIVVTANPFVPIHKVEEFITQKVNWLLTKQKKALQKQAVLYDDVMSDDFFYLFGKKLNIVRIFSNQNKVVNDDENLYVYYVDEKDAHKSVIKFMRRICEIEFVAVVDYYFEKLKDYHFVYPSIKFREMSSRWGSCIPSKNKITLNMKMIHYPKSFLEYVVLHELVHFAQPNHSDSFYQIIQFHMPDYKERLNLVR